MTTHPAAPRNLRRAMMLMALAILPLAGCLQTLPPPVCPPSVPDALDSVRTLVSFRQAVNGSAADTLAQLQTHAGACATYVSSVSPTVHVYVFSGVRDAAVLGQRLRVWPMVLDAVPDAKARSH